MEELAKYLKALLLLQLNNAATTGSTSGGASQPGAAKAEVLLSRAGFTHREIADMLGKTTTAVAKTISRAKSGKVADTELASVGGEG